MKKKRTAQLQHHVESMRRISVSAPARQPARESFRSSRLLRRSICEGWIGEGGFLNPRTWICFALICSLAMSAYADIITVTNTNDSGPGSLRQALADANNGDTINFAVTGTIGLINNSLITNNTGILNDFGTVISYGPPKLTPIPRARPTPAPRP
jgi:hypothetical protein